MMRWGLLAAGLSAVAMGLAVYLSLVSNPWSNPSRSQESDSGVLAEATGVGADGTEELSNLELEDSRVIETDRRLMVTNVKVKAGARITFRAGEVAAFGDGFQISDGGAIIVEVGKPPPRVNKRGGAS